MLVKVKPEDLSENVFSLIGKDWMLVTAGTAEDCNTMTAGWGGLGVLWGEPAATIYIRPQRYTRKFLDREDYFTLNFFSPEYREQLALCGKVSGRDTDKVKATGFTVECASCGAPYFQQARLVLVCKKSYVQPMDPSAIPEEMKRRWYPDQDYHIVYVGQIVEARLQP